jgi:hypothetical protein
MSRRKITLVSEIRNILCWRVRTFYPSGGEIEQGIRRRKLGHLIHIEVGHVSCGGSWIGTALLASGKRVA